MMEAVAVPPFERFYEEHRDAVLGLLVKRLGRQAAEDAFQETFFRALRGYPSLRHADHLRAWVLTIAERVSVDVLRRVRPTADVPDLESVDERPAYEDLLDLTADLPPKERAAVILRYGYDLPYDQIGSALGSSAEAARQAASSGVRRLRRKELR
jgi:RNA polymerase sigma factor (sigma-70 family)